MAEKYSTATIAANFISSLAKNELKLFMELGF
jgi:hypothetical protein